MGRLSAIALAFALFVGACTSTDGSQSAPLTPTTAADTSVGTSTSTAVPPQSSSTPPLPSDIITDPNLAEPFGTVSVLQEDRDANDGSLSLETSLDLFASVYGSLPGVPTSTITDPRPGDGSLAIRSVLAHWDDIDVATQDAISVALAPSQHVETIAYTGEVSAIRAQTDTRLPDAIDAVEAARAAIEAEIGRPLGIPLTVSVFDTRVGGADISADTTPMRSGVWSTTGEIDECSIRFFPLGDTVSLVSVAAHEVFHCFQYTSVADVSQVLNGQGWIIEGQAEWVGARIGGVDRDSASWFRSWIAAPDASLFSLDYAALGFYWVLESVGIDVWTAMPAMLDQRGAAAIAATGGDPSQIWRRALTSMIRSISMPQIDVSADWDFAPAAWDVPSTAMRGAVTVAPSAPFDHAGPSSTYSRAATLDVTLEGDIVDVQAEGGIGALAFERGDGTVTWSESYSEQFCLLEDAAECSCESSEPLSHGTDRLLAGLAVLDSEATSLYIATREVTPDDLLGFADGDWEGFFLRSNSGLSIDSLTSLTAAKEFSDSPFHLSVQDGVVTGAYTLIADNEVDIPPDGTGQIHTFVEGILTESPCNPSMAARTLTADGTFTMSGITTPLAISASPTDEPAPADWVFTQAGPDKVVGSIINTAIPEVEASIPVDFFGAIDLDFIAWRVSS
jgi:hypothetical protein